MGTNLPSGAEPISEGNAARLAMLAQWGEGAPERVAYSSDGKDLALGSSIGIYLYDAETLAQIQFTPADRTFWGLAFSPDGTYLASGLGDGTLRWWAFPAMDLQWSLQQFTYRTDTIVFSPDGVFLVIGSSGANEFHVIDAARGSVEMTLVGDMADAAAVFTPDGKELFTASPLGIISIWEFPAGDRITRLIGPQDLMDIALSPDGKYLAATPGTKSSSGIWSCGNSSAPCRAARSTWPRCASPRRAAGCGSGVFRTPSKRNCSE